MNNETKEQLREEFNEKFNYLEDALFTDAFYGGSSYDPRKEIADWWLQKLDTLLKSQRDSLVEEIKRSDIIPEIYYLRMVEIISQSIIKEDNH